MWKNKKRLKYPDISLYDVLVQSKNLYPNNIVYNYFHKTCTYKIFLKHVDYASRSLAALGIKKGDVVSICMPNTPEAITTFYAINKIGAIANMIHPLSAQNEIKHYINESNSVLLITIDEVIPKIKDILSEINLLKIIVAPINYSMKLLDGTLYYLTRGRKYKENKSINNVMYWGEFIKKGIGYVKDVFSNGKGDDIACILYSSGTTGYSKGILLTNKNFNALSINGLNAVDSINNKSSILSIMPIFHGFGLGVCIHTFIYASATTILIPEFSSKKFVKLIKEYRPSAIVGVPTLYESLSNSKCKKVNLDFLKIVISGGDSLPPAVKENTDNFLKDHNSSARLIEGYGLTECVSACCLTPINKPKKGSIGIPLNDINIKICEIHGQKELKRGEVGEICISGPIVMKGYLNNDKETNEALIKHKDGKIWLHTKDLGYMDDEGYLFFVQRLKRMIISSGYNIYPVQIEKVLNENEYVLTSTVVGIPHPYKLQVAKAYVVLKEGISPTKKVKDSIKDSLEKNIAKYAIPREIEYRKSLPKTKLGKVDYRQLEK